MEELKETAPRKITLSKAARWAFGVLFFIIYFGSLVEHNYFASIFVLISVIILIPPLSQAIEQKFNFTMSGALRFALVVCLLIGWGMATPKNTVDNSVTESNTVPPVVASWTSSATKTTETFHVSSNQWRLSWDTKPGRAGAMNFQIYIYDSDGTLKSVAANVIGANADSTVIHGAGDYFLMINTAQPYTVTVESLS
jgi:hypothetical protein